VIPLVASPSKDQVGNLEATSVHGQPYGIATTEVAEVDVTAGQRRLGGVDREISAKRNLRKSVLHRPGEIRGHDISVSE